MRRVPRRVLYAYVLPFSDNGRPTAVAYCSPSCGNAALVDPPLHWPALRVLVPRALSRVVMCHGCDYSIAEVEVHTQEDTQEG